VRVGPSVEGSRLGYVGPRGCGIDGTTHVWRWRSHGSWDCRSLDDEVGAADLLDLTRLGTDTEAAHRSVAGAERNRTVPVTTLQVETNLVCALR